MTRDVQDHTATLTTSAEAYRYSVPGSDHPPEYTDPYDRARNSRSESGTGIRASHSFTVRSVNDTPGRNRHQTRTWDHRTAQTRDHGDLRTRNNHETHQRPRALTERRDGNIPAPSPAPPAPRRTREEERNLNLAKAGMMADRARRSLQRLNEYLRRFSVGANEMEAGVNSVPQLNDHQQTYFTFPKGVAFEVPESVNPMRVYQPLFKNDWNCPQVQSQARSKPRPRSHHHHRQHLHPNERESFCGRYYRPSTRNDNDNPGSDHTTYQVDSAPTPVTTTAPSEPTRYHRGQRHQRRSHNKNAQQYHEYNLRNVNQLNYDEGRQYILNVIENRLSTIESKLATQLDLSKWRKYSDLKEEMIKLWQEVASG
ncbi:uncharacterized protein IL334_006515 [Kwoniella shivajii]|uniref:Uncharacterized protein n=1 Tax=Kwoniella shivajii TaxID=564305 RepID=A0ABZ1D6I3_9TREE|nr:hypothetical protein IL334_006515 [Kwoniella shivajii]